MQFLENSLLELITQTSTNLPPDVRAAMATRGTCREPRHASRAGARYPRHQYGHGLRERRPDLPGHGHAHVLHPHAGGGQSARDPPRRVCRGRRSDPPRQAAAQLRRFAHRQEQRRQSRRRHSRASTSSSGRRTTIEVRLILKGGGCENKNIQYSLPCPLEGLGRADRNLEGVRKCILHAVWQAQGQGCAPGALGVCIGSDRAHGYELAKAQLLRTLDDTNPEPGAGGARSAGHGQRPTGSVSGRWASAAAFR